MAKPKTVKQVLVKARKLIAEVGWCRGSYAKDVKGRPIWDYPYAGACRYCSIGAIMKATNNDLNLAQGVENYMNDVLGAHPVDINDNAKDKRTVLRAFDKAIKTL